MQHVHGRDLSLLAGQHDEGLAESDEQADHRDEDGQAHGGANRVQEYQKVHHEYGLGVSINNKLKPRRISVVVLESLKLIQLLLYFFSDEFA